MFGEGLFEVLKRKKGMGVERKICKVKGEGGVQVVEGLGERGVLNGGRNDMVWFLGMWERNGFKGDVIGL